MLARRVSRNQAWREQCEGCASRAHPFIGGPRAEPRRELQAKLSEIVSFLINAKKLDGLHAFLLSVAHEA